MLFLAGNFHPIRLSGLKIGGQEFRIAQYGHALT
jgi:hypothetical protein